VWQLFFRQVWVLLAKNIGDKEASATLMMKEIGDQGYVCNVNAKNISV